MEQQQYSRSKNKNGWLGQESAAAIRNFRQRRRGKNLAGRTDAEPFSSSSSHAVKTAPSNDDTWAGRKKKTKACQREFLSSGGGGGGRGKRGQGFINLRKQHFSL